jgi:hypothetical protein
MKANFKKTFTAITATMMCAAAMACTATANAETNRMQKYDPSADAKTFMQAYKPEVSFDLGEAKVVRGTTPAAQQYMKPVTEITRITRLTIHTYNTKLTRRTLETKVPITFINPATDPIGPEYMPDERYYTGVFVNTTKTEVNMNFKG